MGKKKKERKRRAQQMKPYREFRREKMLDDGAYDGRFQEKRTPTKKEKVRRKERKHRRDWQHEEA